MIIMASASGTLVPAIARLVAADEDTVRDVIHTFNVKGLAALDPRRAGGRPRWSLRKLAGYLAGLGRPVRIGRERLRQLLHERGSSFQRTRTWKELPIRTGRHGCARLIIAPTASATSMAATAWAMTSCGASLASIRAPITPWPR
jgi:Winged helix-turn helix